MKKICFIIDSMRNSGGRERVISILSEEFLKYYEVKVLVLDSCTETFYDLNKEIGIDSVKGINKIEKIINLHKYLKKNEKYVYITLSMRFLNLFVAVSAMFTNTKIIATEHCDYFTTPIFFRALKRIFYKKYKYIVTLTEKDKNVIKRWFEKVDQINNPASFYPEYGSKLNNKVVLNVGRLTKQKGQDMLIEAWSKLKKDGWKLVIVGDGELREILLDKIYELRLENTVEIKAPTSKIRDEYLNSDIFVLSSRWEGLPMVLIEAMSCGLPCVSFDCETGPRQLITDDYNGYLIEPNNVDKLSEKLEYLLSHKDNMVRFGENSKKKAEAFRIEHIFNEWQKLIEE